MIWIIPAFAGLLIVYLAARFSRFRRFAEPIVTLAVAVGLIAAFIVWLTDDSAKSTADQPEIVATEPVVAPGAIALTDLSIAQGTPATTHNLTAMIRNDSTLGIDYFTLVVTMQDCPNEVCTTIGEDEALILARLGPGQSQQIRTTLIFPVSPLSPPTAIRWQYRFEKIRTAQ
ncbi:hypothetical protein [Pararhizobium antarcticum]|uniref:DUF3426 domain-containing protein n=1 Tax=Pararhizobium antarcticum TaxID=1798805 RepID=A0A657LX25_9HYPH|nr:hypothetical protein [Pararhizobium antarcticum]OJF93286.1 hypothetical protein AX761_20250 [Rhizobium sp. 58]OJF99528.1 hypothetical protein AX760_12300 [Pararhizobium antarcticum]